MINDNLQNQHCVPCEGGIAPITKEVALSTMMPQVQDWTLDAEGKQISREFLFHDFKEAMVFVNTIADIAEREGHHPDISIWWNKVRLDLSTHAIGGLSTNDFVLAYQINKIKS